MYPKDTNLLGLQWKGSYFLEKHLCFGFKQGLQLFQRISDSVPHIMAYNVLSYIDDHLIFGHKQKCNDAFDRLTSLLQELGFTINQDKNVRPTTSVVCLGILFDTNTFTMSVPPKN